MDLSRKTDSRWDLNPTKSGECFGDCGVVDDGLVGELV